MIEDRDAHGQLLHLVYEYIKTNLKMEARPSLEKTIEVRKLLSDIKKVASIRRDEVMLVQKKRKEFLNKRRGKSNSPEADKADD
jgi:hypothetical protein